MTSLLAEGATFARFTVRRLLCEDPLGALCLADEAGRGRVLLRVLEARNDRLARIEEALRRLSLVVHRNVARVRAGEEDEDGRFFYTLEALGAVTLGELARRGRPLYEREVVWLGRGLAAALAALHEAGTFHGDVRSELVLVSHNGPLLVDLGWSAHLAHPAPDVAAGQAADLAALRALLVKATAPTGPGSTVDLTPKVQALLELLTVAGATASDAARAWKDAAARLGLPDPVAPESLRRLLERHGGGEAEEPSDEVPGLGVSAVDEGEAPRVAQAPGGTGAPPAASSSPPPAASEPAARAAAKRPPASARRTGGTVAYARDMLNEFPVSTDDTGDEDDPPRSPEPASRAGEDAAEPRPSGPPAPGAPGPAGPARSQSGEAPRLGRFGPYELLAEHAAGRTSTVFQATEQGRTRPLALKVMLPGVLGDEALRARFLRAAETAEGLVHPAVARVLRSGVHEGWPYVVSELAPGETLDAVWANASELRAQLPRILLEVLRAVEYAHAHGIVHGDLEPTAIRVDAEGRPRVVELALPRIPGPGKQPAPRSPYAAPELATSGPSEATDLYSLGAILYAAATFGRRPQPARGAARLLVGPLAPPSALAPEPLPPQLDAIALKALAADPADRYPSVRAMAEDLQRCVLGPLQAPLPGRAARLGAWAFRQPGPAALAAVGALLAALLVVGGGALALPRLLAAPSAQGPAEDAPPSGATAAGPGGVAVAISPPAGPSAADRAELARLRGQLGALSRERDELAARLSAAEPPPSPGAPSPAERALPLVELGQAFLGEGDALAAQRAFAAALALDPEHQGAKRGAAQAAALAAQGEPDEEAAEAEADARAHLERGRQLLAREELDAARGAFLEALRAGSPHAKGFLDTVAERRVSARLAATQQEREGAARAEADRLVARGRQLLEARAAAQARDAFLGALTRWADHAGAREGLAAADALVLEQAKSRAAASATSPAVDGARRQVEAAEHAVTLGRERYQQDGDVDAVVRSYLDAILALERARALDPSQHAVLTRRQRTIGSELVTLLERDDQGLAADVILALIGMTREDVQPTPPPRDPHLVVEEAEETVVRRAFAGPVRFVPTRVFDPLRAWVAERTSRYRVVIVVKTEVVPKLPAPAVHAVGLWIRIEDLERRTISAPHKIAFKGGPYPRVVRVDSRGRRVVFAFDQANSSLKPFIEEAERVAKLLIERRLERDGAAAGGE